MGTLRRFTRGNRRQNGESAMSKVRENRWWRSFASRSRTVRSQHRPPARRMRPLFVEHLESRSLLAAVPAGLVSWYRAEGDASDSAGSNEGTLLNGATFTAGKV